MTWWRAITMAFQSSGTRAITPRGLPNVIYQMLLPPAITVFARIAMCVVKPIAMGLERLRAMDVRYWAKKCDSAMITQLFAAPTGNCYLDTIINSLTT